MALIIPAILTSDRQAAQATFKRLHRVVEWVQLDVTDGTFAGAVSITPDDLPPLPPNLKLEVDLMVQQPADYLAACYRAGATRVFCHIEPVTDVPALLKKMSQFGFTTGLSLKPTTPLDTVWPYLDAIDGVLLHSVPPGKQGQRFVMKTLTRVRQLRAKAPKLFIEVDGGVNSTNIAKIFAAGADAVAVGSALAKASNPVVALGHLRAAIR